MYKDTIYRQAAIDAFEDTTFTKNEIQRRLSELPSAQPYTDEEIQKMQNMEQAQLDKAFELGREDAKTEMSAKQPEDCDTCKHGYFGDEQCNSCRVRFMSHYERRADEQTD